MALEYHCHNCGWKESAHLYPTMLSIDEQRKRDSALPGYPLPLRRCPEYRRPRAELVEVLQIQSEMEKLAAAL